MKKIITSFVLLFSILLNSQNFRDNIQKVTTQNLSDLNADFGYATSIHGNKFAVGARGEVSNTTTQETGAVYIYEKQNLSNWTLLYRYSPNDGSLGDEFGYSVDIYENTTVVGARKHDKNSVIDFGAAYVYELDNNGILIREQKLISPSNALNTVNFGHSVSIYENYIVVGALYDIAQNAGSVPGAVHIFKKDTNNNWIFFQTLNAPNPLNGDEFGNAVSIYKDKIIVGAHKTGATNKGATYIYQLNNNSQSWDFVQELNINVSQNSNRQFGFSVDINDKYAIVGALNLNKAYLFEVDSNGNWNNINNSFDIALSISGGTGASVSLFDNYAIVGSPSAVNGGSATILKKNLSNNNWELLQTVNANQENITSTSSNIGFGRSVSMHNQNIIVGAYNGNNEQTPTYESGLVTIYETNTVLSINNENEFNSKLKLYPNPFSNNLKINGLNDEDNFEITIFDINGKSLMKSNKTLINTSKLKKGFYYVKIRQENKTKFYKVIKK